MDATLPAARAALVDEAGRPTPHFYRFFLALQRAQSGSASSADLASINEQIAQIQSQLGSVTYPKLQVSPPLVSNGLLQNGLAQLGVMIANSIIVNDEALQLDGDTAAPGNTYLYSTSTTGVKGWNPLGGMVAGTAGNITTTVNADGTVTFNLATVTDAGGGTLQKTAFDAYGRKTGTSAATTTDLAEGTNLYFTAARAQDAVGAALVGTGDVPLAYDAATRKLSASLSDVAITAGTYGDATHVAQVTFDAKGRATAVASVAISASGGGYGQLSLDGGDLSQTYDDSIDGGALASPPADTYDCGVLA